MEKSFAPALDRGLDILDVIAKERKGFLFSELQLRLPIPKPSLARLLNILERKGYVRLENRYYKLGLKTLSLAFSAQESLEIKEISRGVLESLLKAAGETVELSVPENDGQLIIEKLENYDSPIRLVAKTGYFNNILNATAYGKVRLAYMPEKELGEWIHAHGLKRITPLTITQPLKLANELKKIRSSGVSFDFQESRTEVARISSPVFDHDGKLACVLGIAGPYFRINDRSKEKLGKTVKEHAGRISKLLGYKKEEEI